MKVSGRRMHQSPLPLSIRPVPVAASTQGWRWRWVSSADETVQKLNLSWTGCLRPRERMPSPSYWGNWHEKRVLVDSWAMARSYEAAGAVGELCQVRSWEQCWRWTCARGVDASWYVEEEAAGPGSAAYEWAPSWDCRFWLAVRLEHRCLAKGRVLVGWLQR